MKQGSAAARRMVAVMMAALIVAACSGDDDAGNNADGASDSTTTTVIATTTSSDAVPLGADELQTVVSDAWSAIWVRDWDRLIDVYTAPCRDELTPADFDATLGQGIDALAEGGIDPTETVVAVEVRELVENESANVVSFLTFPGFTEAEEDDTGAWVVDSGTWRRTDCDEILGAGDASAAADLAQGIGSADEPSAFGGVFEFDGWRASVIDIEDASPYLASFSDVPPEGESYLMIVSELLYLGTEFAESDPFLVRAVGSADYESFGNGCALDTFALGAQGIVTLSSAMPGETILVASCVSVPEDEIASIQVVLENAFAISDPEIHYSVDGSAPDPLPAPTLPDVDPAEGAAAFGEIVAFGEDFTGTVVSIHDGVADGLISQFADPPPEGSTHAVVVWEGTYVGADGTAGDPFLADGLGSSVFDPLSSPCSLDVAAMAAAHAIDEPVEFASGESFRGATCFTVPLAELDSVVVQLDNVFDFEVEPVRFAR